MIKKKFGFIFIIISVILAFAILLQLSNIIMHIRVVLYSITTGGVDDFVIKESIGNLLGYILIITISIVLFIFGKKWIKKKEIQ